MVGDVTTICLFTAQYLPNFGGVERFNYELSKQIIRHGDRVIVVTSQLPRQAAQEISPEGVEILRLPSAPLMGGRFPIIKPNKEFHRLTKWLWAQKIDACLINTRFYTLSLYAARAAKKHGVLSVVLEHGSAHLSPIGKLATLAGHLYEHVAIHYVHLFCKDFYGVSEGSIKWLAHFHIQAKGVLHNAVNFDEIDRLLSAPNAVDWRSVFGLPDTSRIILFAARLVKEKGILELLEAFRRLNRPDTHLLIAGDGPLLSVLSGQKGENIHFLGRLERKELMQLYRQADVYCFPSYHEGFPTTLLEAGACGCAVITSSVAGVEELLGEDQCGYILPEIIPEAIQEALCMALDSENWRKRVGASLNARVRTHFGWKQTYAQLMNALFKKDGQEGL